MVGRLRQWWASLQRHPEEPATRVATPPARPGWLEVGTLQTTLATPIPATFKIGDAVKPDLAALRSPRLSSGVSHVVSETAPAGVVHGLVSVKPWVQTVHEGPDDFPLRPLPPASALLGRDEVAEPRTRPDELRTPTPPTVQLVNASEPVPPSSPAGLTHVNGPVEPLRELPALEDGSAAENGASAPSDPTATELPTGSHVFGASDDEEPGWSELAPLKRPEDRPVPALPAEPEAAASTSTAPSPVAPVQRVGGRVTHPPDVTDLAPPIQPRSVRPTFVQRSEWTTSDARPHSHVTAPTRAPRSDITVEHPAGASAPAPADQVADVSSHEPTEPVAALRIQPDAHPAVAGLHGDAHAAAGLATTPTPLDEAPAPAGGDGPTPPTPAESMTGAVDGVAPAHDEVAALTPSTTAGTSADPSPPDADPAVTVTDADHPTLVAADRHPPDRGDGGAVPDGVTLQRTLLAPEATPTDAGVPRADQMNGGAPPPRPPVAVAHHTRHLVASGITRTPVSSGEVVVPTIGLRSIGSVPGVPTVARRSDWLAVDAPIADPDARVSTAAPAPAPSLPVALGSSTTMPSLPPMPMPMPDVAPSRQTASQVRTVDSVVQRTAGASTMLPLGPSRPPERSWPSTHVAVAKHAMAAGIAEPISDGTITVVQRSEAPVTPAPPVTAPADSSGGPTTGVTASLPWPAPATEGADLDEMAKKLYDRIRWRLRTELRLDMERSGRSAGVGR